MPKVDQSVMKFQRHYRILSLGTCAVGLRQLLCLSVCASTMKSLFIIHVWGSVILGLKLKRLIVSKL